MLAIQTERENEAKRASILDRKHYLEMHLYKNRIEREIKIRQRKYKDSLKKTQLKLKQVINPKNQVVKKKDVKSTGKKKHTTRLKDRVLKIENQKPLTKNKDVKNDRKTKGIYYVNNQNSATPRKVLRRKVKSKRARPEKVELIEEDNSDDEMILSKAVQDILNLSETSSEEEETSADILSVNMSKWTTGKIAQYVRN